MKKKLLVLALALVIAAVAVVCVSCAKKEDELVKGNVKYTIVNNTGKNVSLITLSDNRSDTKVESKPEAPGLPDGETIVLELPVMLQNNGADVMFGYTVEGGDSVTAQVTQATATITLVTRDDGISFDVK